MFWNMISCSRTWNHVPKTCSMFKNMNHVLEHEIMFRPWFLVLNMASCYRTWNHVLKHDFMFWNMISCSDHVQPEHDFVMFEHVLNMPEHVLNIEHVQACSGLWTWSEHGGHLVDASITTTVVINYSGLRVGHYSGLGQTWTHRASDQPRDSQAAGTVTGTG